MNIVRNSAKCKKCNEEIESKSVHDFKWCSCKNIAVDGGLEYLKRLYNSDDWIDTSLPTTFTKGNETKYTIPDLEEI